MSKLGTEVIEGSDESIDDENPKEWAPSDFLPEVQPDPSPSKPTVPETIKTSHKHPIKPYIPKILHTEIPAGTIKKRKQRGANDPIYESRKQPLPPLSAEEL